MLRFGVAPGCPSSLTHVQNGGHFVLERLCECVLTLIRLDDYLRAGYIEIHMMMMMMLSS